MYTAWIRNNALPKEDQDYEWPACIIIESETEEKAANWGDHLSKQYCSRDEFAEFLYSKIEGFNKYSDCDLNSVPQIKFGYEASDDEIGW